MLNGTFVHNNCVFFDRLEERSTFQSEYWTFLVLRHLKRTVLNKCVSTIVMKIFSNFLSVTFSKWNRKNMTKKESTGQYMYAIICCW